MLDLSQLLIAHPFPTALARIRRSFARQPDRQTCGAAAIRHGLLLGGLTIPTATLEAVLDIRAHEGTPPENLLACLRSLGLDARTIRKPRRQSTQGFLDGLRADFDQGAFLIPCIYGAEHWVCLGAWLEGRIGLVDSFFDRWRPAPWRDLCPGLGFFSLSPAEFDGLDWEHHVALVRPGVWRSQYEAWLLARAALLRMNSQPGNSSSPVTVVQALRVGVHQYLDDADQAYRQCELHLGDGLTARATVQDPGSDAMSLETLGQGPEQVVVLRRLGGVLTGRAAPPELVVRAGAVRVGQLAG
jgi:hypothetical protein